MTATTALTAQNTKGVYDVHHTPPDFLRKQIDACIEDIGVDVVKTGWQLTMQISCAANSSSFKGCWPLQTLSVLLQRASGNITCSNPLSIQ